MCQICEFPVGDGKRGHLDLFVKDFEDNRWVADKCPC